MQEVEQMKDEYMKRGDTIIDHVWWWHYPIFRCIAYILEILWIPLLVIVAIPFIPFIVIYNKCKKNKHCDTDGKGGYIVY